MVAVGDDGTVWYTDTEGSGWSRLLNVLGIGRHPRAVVYGGDRWVATGLSGQAWYSTTDINTWTEASNPPGFEHLRSIAYWP